MKEISFSKPLYILEFHVSFLGCICFAMRFLLYSWNRFGPGVRSHADGIDEGAEKEKLYTREWQDRKAWGVCGIGSYEHDRIWLKDFQEE